MGFLKKLFYGLRALYINLFYKNVRVDYNVTFADIPFFSKKNNIEIKGYSYVGINCYFSSDVKINKNCLIANNCSFVGGDHKIDNLNTPIIFSGRDKLKCTIIEHNVWIGHGSIILHGVNIKSGSVIGAGSVVTKDTISDGIYAGNPARLIRKRII